MSQTDSPRGEASISRVAVKPPPFWKANPTLWFIQLEAQFALANITVDATKFHHVISVVESDVLNTVSDLILRPPENDKYIALKDRLINLHSESEESKYRRLLQGQELGDQRPSQLLSRMRALAGDSVGDPLLKSLWLSRLPANTQGILTTVTGDLANLASIADKISELTTSPSINVVNSQNTSATSTSLEDQIAQLTKQVNELTTIVKNRENSRNRERCYDQSNRQRSRSRGRFRQYREPENNLCFYHTNFGSKAKKCKQPCSFRHTEN